MLTRKENYSNMSDEFFNENNQDYNFNDVINSNEESTYIQENNFDEGIGFNQDSNLTQENSQVDPSSTYSFWADQIATAKSNHNESSNQNSRSSNESYAGLPYESNSQQEQYDAYSSNFSVNDFDMSGGKRPRKKSKFKTAVLFALGAAVFGLIASVVFIGFNVVYYNINPNAKVVSITLGGNLIKISDNLLDIDSTPAKKLATTTISKDIIQQKTDLTDVVDKTMPSIVTITSTFSQPSYDWFGQEYNEDSEGGGSGIIVGENEDELLVATNNHVVESAKTILVNFIDDTQAKAIVKGTDTIADLAVISIDKSSLSKKTLDAIKIANLGDSESVKVGQMAVAIGNALGYGQSVTVGYISAKDREVTVSNNKMVLLQTDAAINPGNSGGALLNTDGEVIGINSVKYASDEIEGMGYAIPISRALPIINELMTREILDENEKGYLGVYINDVTKEASNLYGWPIGVYVTATVEDGSAEKAGIIAGDIITSVDGTTISNSTQLQEKVTSYRIGTKVKVTVMRNVEGKYKEQIVTVTLGTKPQQKTTEN